MCANLSFCPLLHLSTLLCAQRTCQTSRTAESLPWFRVFFFLSLKLFPLHKSEGVYLEERESGELGMCKSATPTFVKREWKCIKTLILGFYWNYLWLSSQLFHVMCDLFSFTPTRQACGLERFHLLGRGDRAGGITSSVHSSGVSQSISLTKSKEKA